MNVSSSSRCRVSESRVDDVFLLVWTTLFGRVAGVCLVVSLSGGLLPFGLVMSGPLTSGTCPETYTHFLEVFGSYWRY